MRATERKPDFKLTTDTPYLALAGELRGVCDDNFTSPSRASYGVSVMTILKKFDGVITALRCTIFSVAHRLHDGWIHSYIPWFRLALWVPGWLWWLLWSHLQLSPWGGKHNQGMTLNTFSNTGPLWGESTGGRWISPNKGPVIEKAFPLLCRLLVQAVRVWFSKDINPWWRHQMETFSALLTLYAGNSPVTGEFPSQRPVTQSFDVFFDLPLNKPLSKHPWRLWFDAIALIMTSL